MINVGSRWRFGMCAAVLIGATLPVVSPVAQSAPGYPHAKEPIGDVRQVYDGTLTPDLAVNTFRNIDRLFPTRTIRRAGSETPLPRAERSLASVRIANRYDIYDYLSRNRVTGLLVLKDGAIVSEIYQSGNTAQTRWMSMSMAKSVTSTLIGAAVKDGAIASINDQVVKYVPRLKGTAYDGVSVRDVLMMSSGVAWNETYTDRSSDRRALLEAQIAQKPGGLLDVMAHLSRRAAPGSVNNYSTGETQVAGEILYGAIKRPLADYLSEKIWSKVGMESDANWWLDSPNGHEIAGSGISATLRDYGRFGLFMLNGGRIGERSILPDGWIAEASTPKVLSDGKPLNYGYLWWTLPDGNYYATGIFGQHLYINPAEKVVIVVWSAQSKPSGGGVIDMRAFFDGVVTALH